MNIQYKKGVIDLCVLSELNSKDMYGYELSEVIAKNLEISDGTIYPVLRKLKLDGLLTTYLQESSGGPPRKYYKITKAGQEEFLKSKKEWLDFIDSIKKILNKEKKDE